jgi:pimeloyl-ACP methyl ester carboxylesterase
MLTGEMFEPVLGALARRHRVIVPDLPGRGRSSRLPGPYTADRMADDLARFLEAHGIPRVNVLGYSRGGAIAQQFARRYPGRTKRLVLVCSYVSHNLSVLQRLQNVLLLGTLRLLGTGGAARALAWSAAIPRPKARSVNPETARWLQGIYASGEKASSVEAVRAMSDFDSRGWLGGIHCPTLVVCGSKDMLASRAHCANLARGVRGARLHTVEGAGHVLPFTHGEQLVELAEWWLSTPPEVRP